MSDLVWREAERRWQVEQSPDSAMRYLGELSRRGLLPNILPHGRTWGPWQKTEFDGRKQANASHREAADGSLQFRSYSTTVAVYYPHIAELHWNPDLASSVTSARHVSRWHRELGWAVSRRIVSEADIVRSN